MKIYEFVITGGPCGGKTTGLSTLERILTQNGFKVIIVAETATEIINSGFNVKVIPPYVFQSLILDMSLSKEEAVRKASGFIDGDVVILYDRGILDSKAYMSQEEFSNMLKERLLNEVNVRDQYDGVFHLVTAANGAEEFYTLANNLARSETPEQARELDLKTQRAWVGHPHLRIIDNSLSFEEKIGKLCSEILSALGLPEPIEIERKYLIKKPNLDFLLNEIGAAKLNILQTYLTSEEGVERRVRQRGDGSYFMYYYTEKRAHSDLGRVETERKINHREYASLLLEGEKFIRKDRYCFIYKGQYFELDVYPMWDDKAILEIELTKETQEPILPSWIEVIEEVTTNPKYKNYSLATRG